MTKVFVIRSFNLIMSRSRHVQFEVMTSNFSVSPDIEKLKGLLDFRKIKYFEGEHAIYLPPQVSVCDLFSGGLTNYPSNVGIKILKTLGSPRESRYIYGKDLRTKIIMTGSLSDLQGSAKKLFELGIGPKIYDLVEIRSSHCTFTAFVIEHVTGRTPTNIEYRNFICELKKYIKERKIGLVPYKGLDDDDFGPLNCNENLLIRCSDNKPMYIDFQQIVNLK